MTANIIFSFISRAISVFILLIAIGCGPVHVQRPNNQTATKESANFSEAVSSFQGRTIPDPIYGVTVDDVSNPSGIVDSLKQIPYFPTTRIVFDGGVKPSYYTTPINQMRGVSYIMGQILDSTEMGKLSIAAYQQRTQDYVNALGSQVDVWEIGNEVNGGWLSTNTQQQMVAAYDVVAAVNGATAITFFYEGEPSDPKNCIDKANGGNDMFSWINTNFQLGLSPDQRNAGNERLRLGTNYILISWYPQQCNDIKPNWSSIYSKLATIFPNSKIGFGEVGTADPQNGSTYEINLINEFYPLAKKISLPPSYIGGYFWWYYAEEMVPSTKPLVKVLNDAILAGPAPGSAPTPSPTPAPTSTPSSTPVATPTPTPKPSPTPVATPSPTATPVATPTPTPTPVATPSPTPIATVTPTPTPAPVPTSEISLLGNLNPAVGAVSNTRGAEVGMTFRSSQSGKVTAIRFYRAVDSYKGFTAKLYDANGNRMTSVSVASGQKVPGWIVAKLATPVAISANANYTVSYYSPNGRHANTSGGFNKAIVNGPLTGLANTASYGNGRYTSSSGFPASSPNANNYFVDVVFVADSAPAPAPSTSVPPSGSTTLFADDFSTYSTGTCLADGKSFGSWTSVYAGYGCNSITKLTNGAALSIRPKTSTVSSETHAGLVTGPAFSGDISYQVNVQTVQPLRSLPNAWEVAWVVWNYTDDTHFYYFIPKPNGWELGKEDPAYPDAQRFLATGSSPTFPTGKSYKVKITQVANTMSVYVDGVLIKSFTDNERPYTSGKIGVYSEDAYIYAQSVSVSRP